MAEDKSAGKKAVNPAAPPKAAPAPAEAPAGSRRRKTRSLTLAEIEEKIAHVKEKQGGVTSRYARQLLHRKKNLTASQ